MEAKKPPGAQLETQRLGTQVGTTTQVEEVVLPLKRPIVGFVQNFLFQHWKPCVLENLQSQASLDGWSPFITIAQGRDLQKLGLQRPVQWELEPLMGFSNCQRNVSGEGRGVMRGTLASSWFLPSRLPSAPPTGQPQLTWEQKKAAPCHRTDQNRKRLKKPSEGRQAQVWPYDSEQVSTPL